MTNKQLAEQFATEFHANKNWSPLDRNEWRAISMFVEWLDKRPVEPTPPQFGALWAHKPGCPVLSAAGNPKCTCGGIT